MSWAAARELESADASMPRTFPITALRTVKSRFSGVEDASHERSSSALHLSSCGREDMAPAACELHRARGAAAPAHGATRSSRSRRMTRRRVPSCVPVAQNALPVKPRSSAQASATAGSKCEKSRKPRLTPTAPGTRCERARAAYLMTSPRKPHALRRTLATCSWHAMASSSNTQCIDLGCALCMAETSSAPYRDLTGRRTMPSASRSTVDSGLRKACDRLDFGHRP